MIVVIAGDNIWYNHLCYSLFYDYIPMDGVVNKLNWFLFFLKRLKNETNNALQKYQKLYVWWFYQFGIF